MPQLLAIRETLELVGELQKHEALVNRPKDDSHAAVVAEITEELRTLLACMAEYDSADSEQLNSWCSDKNTKHRLENIQMTLNAIALVDTEEATQKNAPRTHDTWRQRAETFQHRIMLMHHTHNLRAGTKYKKDFVQFLNLTSFINKQRETAAIIKKLSDVKEGLSSVADVAGKAKNLASRITTISKTTANFAHSTEGVTHATAAASTASTLATFLQAIPIIGAGITAVSSIVQFGQSFLHKRGVTDKVARGIMVGVAVAATVLTAIFPVAAAAIAAGMVAAGAVMNHIKPYLELRKQVTVRENDLSNLKNRLLDFDKPDTTLNKSEKTALIQRLQQNFIQDKSANIEDLNHAKRIIFSGNLAEISSNPQVIHGMKLGANETITSVLKAHNQTMQEHTSTDITKLKSQRNEMLAQSITDVFSVAGAVMLAIPFPPVMIAGAALLLVSSAAALIIKYKDQIANAFTKLKDGFKNFFGIGKNKEALEDVNKHDHDMKNSVEMKAAPPHQPIVTPIVSHDVKLGQAMPDNKNPLIEITNDDTPSPPRMGG